jgi:predicted DsbA family dithiol-disulfide isomerase
MQIEIWADLSCPWCYIGKRNVETALELFAHREKVEVTWRSFQLEPDMAVASEETMRDHLARKHNVSPDQATASMISVALAGARVGLELELDKCKPTNTYDAHRLVRFAAKHGRQNELVETMMHAYFTDSVRLDDRETLIRLGSQAGLEAADVETVLDRGQFGDEVAIEVETAQDIGITGVPFAVVDRTYAISGAQPHDVILDVLQDAWADSQT